MSMTNISTQPLSEPQNEGQDSGTHRVHDTHGVKLRITLFGEG